jgi:hypothetical protein
MAANRNLANPAGRLRALLLVLLLAACAACAVDGEKAADDAPLSLSCRSWPAADRLFRQDARWLGGDDAHSVDLGQGRVLWLFGDTLVDPEGQSNRRQAEMIRNSIGIQTGYDPETAGMTFFWKQVAAMAASFFPESGTTWYWPGDGIRIGSRLLIFLTAVNAGPDPLGFALTGWEAVMIDNPDESPERWQTITVKRDPVRFGVIPGTGGILMRDGFVYAYGCDATGQRAYLTRWHEKKAAAGDLQDPQWWCGEDGGWLPEDQIQATPAVLFTDAQSEFGVYHESPLNRYVQIQTIGFGAANLGFRTAPSPQGPWGPLTEFFSPEEKLIPGILIYATKTHPFLTGADLVVTYATNHLQPQRIMDDATLYVPRFLKIDIQ